MKADEKRQGEKAKDTGKAKRHGSSSGDQQAQERPMWRICDGKATLVVDGQSLHVAEILLATGTVEATGRCPAQSVIAAVAVQHGVCPVVSARTRSVPGLTTPQCHRHIVTVEFCFDVVWLVELEAIDIASTSGSHGMFSRILNKIVRPALLNPLGSVRLTGLFFT